MLHVFQSINWGLIVSDDQWTIYTQEEGEEKEEFFTILGGKTEYLNAPELSGSVREPRLFQCSNASGQFGVCHHQPPPLLSLFITEAPCSGTWCSLFAVTKPGDTLQGGFRILSYPS